MQPYLDAINQQAEAGQKLMALPGHGLRATGRGGGGYYGKLVKDVGDATATDVANASAQALMGSRQAALAAQMEAPDLINKSETRRLWQMPRTAMGSRAVRMRAELVLRLRLHWLAGARIWMPSRP